MLLSVCLSAAERGAWRRLSSPSPLYRGVSGCAVLATVPTYSMLSHAGAVRACRDLCRRVSQRKVLPQTSSATVYEIIAGIEQYPQFLPWCSRTSIETRQPTHAYAQVLQHLTLSRSL